MSILKIQQSRHTGLSLHELLSVVVIVCVLLFVSISWFMSFRIKTKTSEAQTNLSLIYDAEVLYYQHSQPDNPDPESSIPNRKVFLPLSPQPTQPGPSKQDGDFSHGDWALLNIKISNPVYYSYSVATKGEGNAANFTAIAHGDLNGDGRFSRWEIRGRLNPNDEILGKNQIYSLDPLE